MYLAILANPKLGVKALADMLGLEMDVARAALDELMDMALLTKASEGGFRAVSPNVGLVDLIIQAEAEIAQRQRDLEITRVAVLRLAAAQDEARSREQLVVLNGIDAVRARIEELARAATDECVSLNPNFTQTVDAKNSSAPLNEQMLERGVRIRAVYQNSFRNDARLLAHARDFVAWGGQIRVVPAVPLLMIIYDRSVALLPIDPDDTRRGAYEIRNLSLVAAARALFEQTWSSAAPIGESAPKAGPSELDPQLRALLEILASGGTDEAAARKLGVSVRTVKRMSAQVMEILCAKSRFEAGMKAAQRGWV